MSEHLLLKWGTLKGWHIENEETLALMKKYIAGGVSAGAMTQKDTDNQKTLICEIIDKIDGPITNDWSGEDMTKAEAKKYVLGY